MDFLGHAETQVIHCPEAVVHIHFRHGFPERVGTIHLHRPEIEVVSQCSLLTFDHRVTAAFPVSVRCRNQLIVIRIQHVGHRIFRHLREAFKGKIAQIARIWLGIDDNVIVGKVSSGLAQI